MKNHFQSSESLDIRLTPFVSKATGDYVVTGADTCTLTIRKPDGSLLTGGTVTATWDSVAKVWTYTVSTGSYAAGEWRVYATSSDSNCLPKWQILYWGGYVDDITTAKNSAAGIDTKLGTPAGASVSADVAAVATSATTAATQATTAATQATAASGTATSIDTKLGTPAGASVSADIAALNTKLGTPVGASVVADITTTKNAALAAQTAAEAAEDAAGGLASDLTLTKADAAAAKTAAQAAQASALAAATDTGILKKIQVGRWRVIGSQLVLYELDGVTEFKRFDLFDDLGNPSGTRIFERVPA